MPAAGCVPAPGTWPCCHLGEAETLLAHTERLSCSFLCLQQPTPCPRSRAIARLVTAVRAGGQTQPPEAVGVGSVGYAPLMYAPVDDVHAHVSADARALKRHVQQPQRLSPSRSLEDTAPGVPGSGRQFHVLQVRKKPRDTPWEDVLGYILGMYARFCIEPEQGHLGKFLEFVVANLPQ